MTTAAEAGWYAQFALFHEWRQLIAAGFLTPDGLLAVRARLDVTSQEFEPGPDLDLLRLLVDEAVARSRGIDPDDMPGAVVVPDSPEGLVD
jgi:hypothetical protein